MLMRWSAMTASARTSVPGSLRTENASALRMLPSGAAVAGRGRLALWGIASTRKRVRLLRSVWMSDARMDSPNSSAARGDSTAAEPVSRRSLIIFPDPAVLVAASSVQGRERRNASAWLSAWICE